MFIPKHQNKGNKVEYISELCQQLQCDRDSCLVLAGGKLKSTFPFLTKNKIFVIFDSAVSPSKNVF